MPELIEHGVTGFLVHDAAGAADAIERAADLDRAVRLLRHAVGAATEAERIAYLDRARDLVDDIAGRATVRLGPGARRQLGEFAVAALPGPGSGGDQREARGAP